MYNMQTFLLYLVICSETASQTNALNILHFSQQNKMLSKFNASKYKKNESRSAASNGHGKLVKLFNFALCDGQC